MKQVSLYAKLAHPSIFVHPETSSDKHRLPPSLQSHAHPARYLFKQLWVFAQESGGRFLAPQPGELTLGKLAGGEDAAVHHGLLIHLPCKISPHLAIAHRTNGGKVFMQVAAPVQT